MKEVIKGKKKVVAGNIKATKNKKKVNFGLTKAIIPFTGAFLIA